MFFEKPLPTKGINTMQPELKTGTATINSFKILNHAQSLPFQ